MGLLQPELMPLWQLLAVETAAATMTVWRAGAGKTLPPPPPSWSPVVRIPPHYPVLDAEGTCYTLLNHSSFGLT